MKGFYTIYVTNRELESAGKEFQSRFNKKPTFIDVVNYFLHEKDIPLARPEFPKSRFLLDPEEFNEFSQDFPIDISIYGDHADGQPLHNNRIVYYSQSKRCIRTALYSDSQQADAYT